MAKIKERKPVTGLRINTPADFCSTLGAHSHSLVTWTRFRGEHEQILRHTLDGMFKNLPFVDALDPDSVAEFLDDIESPLETLHHFGVQLFVISASGKKAIPPVVHKAGRQVANWKHNSYIVAPDPAFFWLESRGFAKTVHMLTGACREGIMGLVSRPDAVVHVSPSLKHLSDAFEGEIPWCPLCFLESTRSVVS